MYWVYCKILNRGLRIHIPVSDGVLAATVGQSRLDIGAALGIRSGTRLIILYYYMTFYRRLIEVRVGGV